MSQSARFHPASYLTSSQEPQPNRSLLILNSPIASITLLRAVWGSCGYRVAADGGANRLYELFGQDEATRQSFIPDLIHGDLDSIKPHVRQYYSEKKRESLLDPDQYSTDFGKCIRKIREQALRTDSLQTTHEVLILGSIGNRVDQGLGLLSEMMRESTKHSENERPTGPQLALYLVSECSLSFLLQPGENILEFPPRSVALKCQKSMAPIFTRNVGIIPMFGPGRISTTGLEWDVSEWPTRMGENVSTSNHVVANEVRVGTDVPMLFTIELHEDFLRSSCGG